MHDEFDHSRISISISEAVSAGTKAGGAEDGSAEAGGAVAGTAVDGRAVAAGRVGASKSIKLGTEEGEAIPGVKV